jgi:predicted esterase
MKTERKKINIDFPIDYQMIDRGSEELAILLHGFGQNSEIIKSDLLDSIPEKYNVLIPNGPFPIPKIRPEKIEERFAWYFYNSHTNTYKIEYSFPATLLSKLIDQLGYSNSKKIIIGYSQGGYLSPFLASQLEGVTSIYALACTLKWQYIQEEKLPYTIHQIHGEDDLMVDYKNSYEHYEQLKERAIESEYITIKNEGHRITEPFKECLSKLILKQ